MRQKDYLMLILQHHAWKMPGMYSDSTWIMFAHKMKSATQIWYI